MQAGDFARFTDGLGHELSEEAGAGFFLRGVNARGCVRGGVLAAQHMRASLASSLPADQRYEGFVRACRKRRTRGLYQREGVRT